MYVYIYMYICMYIFIEEFFLYLFHINLYFSLFIYCKHSRKPFVTPSQSPSKESGAQAAARCTGYWRELAHVRMRGTLPPVKRFEIS